MGRSVWIPGFLVVCAALLAGCGEDYGPDGIAVLSNGKAPRQALRFQVREGDQQRVTLRLTMRLSGSAAGRTMPTQSAPPQTLDMECTVLRVAPEGDITYEVRLDDPMGAPGPMADLGGMTGSVVVTDRGVTKFVSLDLPPTADPMVKQVMETMKRSVEQMSAPFPEEPVGVGAEWKHHTTLEVMGLEVTQVTTFRLVSLRGTRGKLELSIVQEAEGDEFEVPGLPKGASVELETFKSRAHGSMEFDLARVAPLSAQLDLDMDVGITATHRGESVKAKMQLNGAVELATSLG